MRPRTSEYTPSPASKVIPVSSGRTIRLLPGSAFANANVGRRKPKDRLEAASANAGEEAPPVGILIMALTLFCLWDDPEIEWVARFDPDELLDGSDDALLAASVTLAREMLSVSTAKCHGADDLAEAFHVALTGKRPGEQEEPAPGE